MTPRSVRSSGLSVGLVVASMMALVAGAWGCEFGPWSHGTAAKSAAPKTASQKGGSARGKGSLSGKGDLSQEGALSMRSHRDGEAQLSSAGMAPGGSEKTSSASPSSKSVALEHGIGADGSPWIGGKDAKVVIEEFSDFGCPFCRKGAEVMQELLDHFGRRIKVVFRQMPITALHPDSFLAAEASLAAAAQGKFWPMHDLLFAHPRAHSMQELMGYARKLGLNLVRFRKDMDEHRFKAKIQTDGLEGGRRGVQGTPTFFVTGRGKVEGYLPFDAFRKIVEDQLSTE